ncbi:zinc finger CCHC domain-containing protein 9-like [Watersipora subatra]|uniref:zinc finger CCHC domain-containing protein 9-like n=1 Tax=Watersipora subatra TaxID=2589382 RepID=UPI00355C4346
MTRTATKPGKKKRALDATPWEELSSNTTVKKVKKKTEKSGKAVSLPAKADKTEKRLKAIPDAIKEVKRIRKSESRRVKRIAVRGSGKHCFNCRKTGHVLSNCPKTNKQTEGTGICFKCGSTNHTSKFCKVKTKEGGQGAYPYATCFVCKLTGHISKDCPNNDHGLYPNGGCCLECGSVRHFRRDCPVGQRKKGVTNYTLSTMSNSESADVEPMKDDLNAAPKKVLNKRKTKFVVMT